MDHQAASRLYFDAGEFIVANVDILFFSGIAPGYRPD
jgi:hypothetical protein